jgi:hypothetical protein
MHNLDPIMEQMNDERLLQLDDLNEKVEQDYTNTLRNIVHARELMYIEDGDDEATAKAKAREVINEQYEQQLQHLVLEQHEQDIADLLPEFTSHLDPSHPDYEQHVDDVYAAIHRIAALPRAEWAGDTDEEDEFVGNGFFHDVAREYDPNYGNTEGAPEPEPEPDDPEPTPTPTTPAIGRASVPRNNAPVTAPPAPQAPEQRRHFDNRESVVEKRHGVKVGERMAFTQKLPNGVEMSIQYRVAGFPPQLQGEPNPPVMLERVEQYFLNGQAISPPNFSRYAFSGDHLKHMARDVKEFKKSKGQAMELGAYWQTIDKREKREQVKDNIKLILGAAALQGLVMGATVEMQRRGHDFDAARHGIAHAFNIVRDWFHSGGHETLNKAIPNTLGNTPGGASVPETFSNVDPHAFDILSSKIGSGQSGLRLYHELGLSPDQWFGQEGDLLKNHPGDFYQMKDGHVGLLHPGKPLSPGAALDIAFMNGLVR